MCQTDRVLPRPSGTVLVIVAVGLLLLMGFAAAFMPFAVERVKAAQQSTDASAAFYAARAAIVRARAEIVNRYDYDVAPPAARAKGDPTLGAGGFLFGGASVTVTRADLGSNRYTLTASATKAGIQRRIEEVLAPLYQGNPIEIPGAVTSNSSVTTTGSISIDGRDWAADNSGITGPGKWGISSSGGVAVSGSSAVGGKGMAPVQNATSASGVFEQNASWANGADEDGDGATDEEAWDGADNDGDGKVDEDTSTYAGNPDLFFRLDPGTLKTRAQAAGTYFSSQAAFDAFRTANGGNLPGGKLYYLDFDQCVPTTLGTALQAEPSILVHHNAAGTANMKNLHGPFKGLIVSDTITHINGDALILGGVISFAPFEVGNAYGNGAAVVRYSGEVLADPAITNLVASDADIVGYQAVSWRVVP